MKKGVTVMELVITIIIISILVMVALPSFHTMQEVSLNREAYGTLKRMQEAERLYNMEFNQYYPTAGTESNISNINRNLKIDLSATASPNWNYALVFRAAGTCVQATRNGDDGRIWNLEINDNANTDSDWLNNQTGACP